MGNLTINSHKDGSTVVCSMGNDSMVDMGSMDKLGKTGKVGDVFCDVFHNCRIHSHHRIDRNQIMSIFFPPFDFHLGYAM